MLRSRRLIGVLLLAALIQIPRASSAQVTSGQTDTFQSGIDNWFFGGGPAGPSATAPDRVLTGGPQGADDAYMRLVSTGLPGTGSRLSISNAAQWSGDYRAAGITHIGMWVNNLGSTDLSLRMAFETLGAEGPTNIAFSSDAIFLGAGSGWQQILFPVLGNALLNSPIPGSSVEGAMTNTTLIRLYHSPDDNFPNPLFPIESVAAELGVDDISAHVIPEPSTFLLLSAGVFGLVLARRHTRTRLDRQ